MAKTMMFNPYTGTPRHPSDIASDPAGLLILDDGEPLRAAPALATQGVPADLTPLAKRRIFDAIRAAYDLGWSDRQNGTHAAKEVEADHGAALISGLAAIAYLATPAPAQAQQAEAFTFDRRWRIASDGFGLQRDDEDGCYVHFHDAVDVLHRALAATKAETEPLKARPDFIAGYDAGLIDGRACERRDRAEATPAQAQQAEPMTVPHPGSDQASKAIDAELEARNWPTNSYSAARAGYEACRKLAGIGASSGGNGNA